MSVEVQRRSRLHSPHSSMAYHSRSITRFYTLIMNPLADLTILLFAWNLVNGVELRNVTRCTITNQFMLSASPYQYQSSVQSSDHHRKSSEPRLWPYGYIPYELSSSISQYSFCVIREGDAFVLIVVLPQNYSETQFCDKPGHGLHCQARAHHSFWREDQRAQPFVHNHQ